MSLTLCSPYYSYKQSASCTSASPSFLGKDWHNFINVLEPELLEFGDKGNDVTVLQKALKAIAMYDGPIDGDFGHKTMKAVQILQRALGIEINGIFDSLTWYSLTFWTPPFV